MNSLSNRVRRPWMLALSMALAGMVSLPALGQVLNAPAPPDVGIDQKLNSQVPLDLTFRDETGKEVKLKDLMGGKPTVLALVYYECPMLCGEIMQGMLEAFNKLDFTIGDQYEVLTISFNPKETSALAAAKKKTMLSHYKQPDAGAGWRFLTGDEANIKKIAEAVGFRYQYIPSADQYAHGSGIMILTPEGKVSRYFYGIQYPKRDLRWGLIEASKERIGSLADEVLLLCYHYDPATGTYGLVIMRTLRLAGLVTVLALGLLVGTLFLNERRKRNKAAREHDSAGSPAPMPSR